MNFKIAIVIAVGLIIASSSSFALTQRNIEIVRIKNSVENSQDNILELNGSIIAEISDDFLGSVYPRINLTGINNTKNYILEFNVTQTGNIYNVDGKIKIDIEVLGNFSRQFLFGRYLAILIFIIRETGNKIQFNRSKLNSDDEKYVEIPLHYETSVLTENADMYIYALGPLSGALSGDKPIFVNDKIDLEFSYIVEDIIDETPPVTKIELEGQKIEV